MYVQQMFNETWYKTIITDLTLDFIVDKKMLIFLSIVQ